MNPYVSAIISLVKDAQGWLLALVGVVTAFKVAQYGLAYQNGDDDDKVKNIKSIRKTFMMGGGIFFLIWIATYVVGKMQAV